MYPSYQVTVTLAGRRLEMFHPVLSLELARAHQDLLRADGGGHRRARRRRTGRRGRLREAVGFRLLSVGVRLLDAEVR
jgi:hypothetical protein